MEVGHAFRASKALLSAVELGVFTALGDGPLDSDSLRKHVGIYERGPAIFWTLSSRSVMLVRQDDGRYANSAATGLYLDCNKPTYIGGVLESSITRTYTIWGALTSALRTGKPQSNLSMVTNFSGLYADEVLRDAFAEHNDGTDAAGGEGAGEKLSLGRTIAR